jgi:hypothetical protein
MPQTSKMSSDINFAKIPLLFLKIVLHTYNIYTSTLNIFLQIFLIQLLYLNIQFEDSTICRKEWYFAKALKRGNDGNSFLFVLKKCFI